MKKLSQLVTVLSAAMCMSMAAPIYAESAPVYDADSMPQQQYDGDTGGNDDPDPAQDGGTFVPMRPAANSSSTSNSMIANPTPPMSLSDRVKRVEQQVNNMQGGDSGARLDSLQNQVQALRGQIEQLTRQLQQAQDQQKSMYADLDKRINEASKTASAPEASVKKTSAKAKAADASAPTVVAASAQTQPDVAEEQEIYQKAYALIKAKKYNDAVNTLQGMLKKYPSGQFASNAHYWLGELYGLMGKNDQALVEFSTVVKSYPDSPRVSDAQLKVGLIYATQSKWADAKATFKHVINQYPGTASARLAAEQLKQLKQAGH